MSFYLFSIKHSRTIYLLLNAKKIWIRYLIPSFTFWSVFIEASRARKCGNVTSCNCGWSILNASVAQHVGSSTAASNYASPDINHRKYEGHWRNLSIDTLLPLRENSCAFLKTRSTLKCQLVIRNVLLRDIRNILSLHSNDKYLSSIEYDFAWCNHTW